MEKILLALVSKTIQESTSGRAGFRGYEDVSITQSLVISTLCSFILASLSGNPWWQEAPSCNLPGSESVGKNAASLSNSGSSKSLISCHFITYIHHANPTILPVKLSHTRARDYSHLSEPGRQAEAGGFHPQENGHTSQKALTSSRREWSMARIRIREVFFPTFSIYLENTAHVT